MANRSTNRILLLIIVVLLVTNILMFFLFALPKDKGRHHERRSSQDSGMSEILRDTVGFSSGQVADYMKLRSEERPKLKEYFTNMRTTKEKFYSAITSPVSDSLTLSLADSIGNIQKQIDLHMQQYFIKIRQICTPEQLPAFDSTIMKTVGRMIGRQGRNKNAQIKKQNK